MRGDCAHATTSSTGRWIAGSLGIASGKSTLSARGPVPPPPRGGKSATLLGRGASDVAGGRYGRLGRSVYHELVGPVSESEGEHLARHNGGMRSCPRCRWYKHRKVWTREYGMMEAKCGVQAMEWLQERPVRWGGTWALGCAVCSDLCTNLTSRRRTDSESAAPAASRGRLSRFVTSWGKYEIRAAMLMSEHVRQHSTSEVHRRALWCFGKPDSLKAWHGQVSLDDERLLAGAVPQAADWLRVWRGIRSRHSWDSTAAGMQTEEFIRETRHRAPEPKSLTKMTRIMQEVAREAHRRVIQDASAISIGLDDRGGHKLVRFRCDSLSSPAASRGGVLGCIDCLEGVTLEELACDYAERAAGEVLNVVKRFCTPLEDESEDSAEQLQKKFLRSVRSIVADGALMKTAQRLREHMPNVILITRDPAHLIRLSCQEPLIRTAHFDEQHRRLFGKKGSKSKGLLKNIQFSSLLQARLQDCQRKVIASQGAQGGGITGIMQDFSWAPQRFESFAGPRRKYVCSLRAIVLLLCDLASDSRRKRPDRDAAEEALDAMTPQNILEVGLTADFAECCIRYHVAWSDLQPIIPICKCGVYRYTLFTLRGSADGRGKPAPISSKQ